MHVLICFVPHLTYICTLWNCLYLNVHKGQWCYNAHISHRPSEWWSAQLTCGVAQVVVFSFPSWAAAEAAVVETGWYCGADLALRENYSRAHSHCLRIPLLINTMAHAGPRHDTVRRHCLNNLLGKSAQSGWSLWEFKKIVGYEKLLEQV